jgi:hypothetical protein
VITKADGLKVVVGFTNKRAVKDRINRKKESNVWRSRSKPGS